MKPLNLLLRVGLPVLLLTLSSTIHAQSANAVSATGSTQTLIPPVQPVVGIGPEITLEHLGDRLNLNEQQKKLWQQFEARVQAWEQNLYKEQPVWAADANVLSEMGRLTLNQQNRLTLLEDMEISVKALYAVLSQEQQAILNASLLRAIPGLLPSDARNAVADAPASQRERGRIGSGGSGRRRSGGFGGAGGTNW